MLNNYFIQKAKKTKNKNKTIQAFCVTLPVAGKLKRNMKGSKLIHLRRSYGG